MILATSLVSWLGVVIKLYLLTMFVSLKNFLYTTGRHFDWLKSHNLFNVSLTYKRNATLIWRQIQSKFDSIKEHITDADIAREMSLSLIHI